MNLLKSSRIHSFNRGDTVFREGEMLNSIYIIKEGEFSVSKKDNSFKKDLLIYCYSRFTR